MRKYVLAPLTVGCLNFNDMSSVFFYSASGGKMVTYHSSGLHVSAPAFISRGIASSNIQCRSQFVFSAKMTILLIKCAYLCAACSQESSPLHIISMPVHSVYILAVISVGVLVCCNGLCLCNLQPYRVCHNMAALEPLLVPTGPSTGTL